MDRFLKKLKVDDHDDLPGDFQKCVDMNVNVIHDEAYLKFGFIWNEDGNDPRPLSVLYDEALANESMVPSKFQQHLIAEDW